MPPVDSVRLAEEYARLGDDEAYAEYSLLIESVANLLLQYDRFLFHGAAFMWHGKAYILTAPSGVGKSTQLKHWMDLYPDETKIINGDKPIIEQKDSEFIVHPSPWTGKENWGGTKSAPLGGIILLEQGNEDHICRISSKDAAYPIFLQFLYLPKDEGSLNRVCSYEEKMLNSVPIWKLTNTGSHDSARLTHQMLIEEEL